MELRRSVVPAFVLALLATPVVAHESPRAIPNWSAPKTWTPPRDRALAEKLRKIEELRGGVTLGAESLPTGPLPFFAVNPCRIVDTRPAAAFPAGYGAPAMAANASRDFDLNSAAHCPGIPAGAQAYSINVTVTETTGLGDLRLWPAGSPPAVFVSTQNWPGAGLSIANAAVVGAGTGGAITAYVAGSSTHLIIDINGYYAGSATAGVKTVSVDCTLGQSIQAAIDREDGPLVVEVNGICSENVFIRHKQVTLRGTDPATDGIQGVPSAGGSLALRLAYADLSSVENLSISNGAGNGVIIFFSRVTLMNCRLNANAGNGLTVVHSPVMAGLLTISNNQLQGARVENGSFFRCIQCDLQNNTGFAAAAVNGGVLTLHDSVVTGTSALLSATGSYADIDCVSSDTPHACGLNASGRAAQAFTGATAAIYGTGNFTGQVESSDNGTVQLIGARQTAVGTGGLATNRVSSFGQLVAGTDETTQSQLFGPTSVTRFGRLLLLDMTTLAGSIQCGSAGDAWLDPTIVAGPGASITGCEHGALPPP